MPKCTINGKEVEVKDGATIMEAFYKSTERIAHYCYHPGLSVAGVCRLCIVDIEGNPRPQIACNTQVTEGMKVTNSSAKIKDGVKWVLDFHLINHPLDCPICDQAGECGLQDQYMEFGKYDPEMAEKKVKKHKVVDLGPTVVLDSERCILCSRCVRFTDEVSKTSELGIFNRGDRSEIGCVDGKKLENKYSLNTVDICPVGALTSKDFRFRQRVWYLKDAPTLCNGCSTGCNVRVYFNKEGVFRVKPEHNEKINGHWMCDEGRDVYKFVNRPNRFLNGLHKVSGSKSFATKSPGALALDLKKHLESSPEDIHVVLTGQFSVEEYLELQKWLKTKKIYHWVNNPDSFESFDGILLRGDKNPNTYGLKKVFGSHFGSWQDLERDLNSGQVKKLLVFAPENMAVYPDLVEKAQLFAKAKSLVWLGASKNQELETALHELSQELWVLPLKSFVEKSGTFINHQGLEQKFKKVTTVVSEALTVVEVIQLWLGTSPWVQGQPGDAQNVFVEAERSPDRVLLENRKKNEFVFKRGPL